MRFLHTADWHLGRLLNGRDMLDDQRFTLGALVDIAKTANLDAIVVAGDVYDRSQPPERAIELYDEAVTQLAGIAPLLVIAGNHDSAVRIDSYSRLLEKQRVFVCGTDQGAPRRVEVTGADGLSVAFDLMPFATVGEVRQALDMPGLQNHHDATQARLAGVGRHGKPSVLVGHLFAAGGTTCESERDITVGGTAAVGVEMFSGYSYVALGHLHRPHDPVEGRVRYSGSMCRYSFSEEDHEKSVTIVEVSAKGSCGTEVVPLPQRVGMKSLRGTFDELMRGQVGAHAGTQDMIRITLTDATPVFQANAELRKRYPNLCELSYELHAAAVGAAPAMADLARQSAREFLGKYLQERYGDRVPAEVKARGESLMDEVLADRGRA